MRRRLRNHMTEPRLDRNLVRMLSDIHVRTVLECVVMILGYQHHSIKTLQIVLSRANARDRILNFLPHQNSKKKRFGFFYFFV